MSVQNLLAGIPLFAQFSAEELEHLVEIGRTESCDASCTVFSQGDAPDKLYLILSGSVAVSKEQDKTAVVLVTLEKGKFFGEMALVEQSLRSATVFTLEPCEFFVVERAAFMALLSQSPRLVPAVLASMVSKLHRINEQFLSEVLEKQKLYVGMERERQRSLTQIAAVCNDANTIAEAMQIAVNEVCAYTGWPVGHVYEVSGDSEKDLFSLSVWHLQDPEQSGPFQKLSEMTHFSSGVGLPGMVLATGKPAWIEDLKQESDCPRAKVAMECGLRSAFAIPVVAGKQVSFVLEFFCDQPRERDLPFLEAMSLVGNQLGRVIERKRYEETLLHNAFHDPLTDLPNRALFLNRLGMSLARVKRDPNYLFAVLFLDLDRFKIINDSLGHLVGDQMLLDVGQRLQTCVRAVDTVARLGGDEFAILVEDVQHWSNVPRVIERIRKKLQTPVSLSGRQVQISASIGIALSSLDYERSEELLRDADTAMYQAKAKGLGLHEVFEPRMRQQVVNTLSLQSELRVALEKNQLELHYQPILAMESGQIVSFEALLRWRHPQHGLRTAGEFLPVAKESELIFPITNWILQEICRQARRWQDQLSTHPPLLVNVNLPSKYFAKQNLTAELLELVSKHGLSPSNLQLEITEDDLIRNPESAARVLSSLNQAGIQILIDDFGTGYSSLSYLSTLPVRGLKIDRSFVAGLDGSQKNAAIVRSIVSLGQHLGLDVIAEGVETKEQLDYLREVNCPYLQGFYFSRPLEQDAAIRLFQEGIPVACGNPAVPAIC
ncbi:MAG: EAL domain-containing protein [Terriglobia bacterium]